MTPGIPRQIGAGRAFASRVGRQLRSAVRLAMAGLLTAGAALQAVSAGLAEEALWPDAVRRVDRARQRFVRLPDRPQPAVKASAALGSFRVRGFFRVHDSVSFTFKGQHYRLANVDPIPNKQTCVAVNGARTPCGLEARTALEALLKAIGTVCVPTGTTTDAVLVACRAGNQDIATLQAAQGYATASLWASVP